MPEPSTLDARLAEIDERLRALQDGLADEEVASVIAPVDDVPPPTPLRPPAPVDDGDPADRLRDLVAAHEQLLELHRDLLEQYASLLGRRADGASVVAGPFPDATALRAFTQGLGTLPGVTAVTTRELLSDERAVFDVRLGGR